MDTMKNALCQGKDAQKGMRTDFLVHLETFASVFDPIKYAEHELDKQEKNDPTNTDKHTTLVNSVNIAREKAREQIFRSCQGYMDYQWG
jgi:hypothetical protein